jgi:predicted peptidase
MKRKNVVESTLLILFVCVASIVASLSFSRQMAKAPTIPSRIQMGTLQPGDRHYTIALPSNYSGDQPVPLVLALHYGGHGSDYYGRDFLTGLVEPALRDLGAIIVAPDCTGDDWMQSNSEKDVLELLDHIKAAHNIDSDRTLITGYSMGGTGTWYLAARHQDRFAAALPMAATPPSSAIDAAWDIPLYVIHGSEDELFPLSLTEAAVEQLATDGVSVELAVVDGASHHKTHRYIKPLQNALPWIQEAWQ